MKADQITATGTATYCPEDDKIRLYVGRVPRAEYDALRAEGWTSTPKQDCDFVAVWTPTREDTALAYGDGEIEDEDQSPADRAADRAERFAGYRDKRSDEAHERADAYDAGPAVHGCQSQALAERRAARHDMQATRAVSRWEKAEYWQHRTAGVISHALHVAAPGVRMGRIKTLEAELRRIEGCAGYARSENHLRLRLAYENQMLEAQGGRLAAVDMEPGGWLGQRQIQTVHKSPATGRVTSVKVRVPRVSGWQYQVANVPGTDYALLTIETERLPPDAYRAPTDEERAAFIEARKAEKKAAKETSPKKPPLVNPTKEDAERLQALWNEQANRRIYGKDQEVYETTQAVYSANSGGTYTAAETVFIEPGGRVHSRYHNRAELPPCCKVRCFRGRVLILTDKPQKPIPADAWRDVRGELRAEIIAGRMAELCELAQRSWQNEKWTDEEKELWHNARLAGLAYSDSMSQFGLTDAGQEAAQSITDSMKLQVSA